MKTSWNIYCTLSVVGGSKKEKGKNLIRSKKITSPRFIHRLHFPEDSLGPFNVENKMIVSKARHTGDGSCSVLAPVKANESKALKWGTKKLI